MKSFFFCLVLVTALMMAMSTGAVSALAQQDSRPASAAPLIDLTPNAHGELSQEQMRQLLRIVADKDIENEKRLRDYTYIERDEQHRLDPKGQIKSTEVKTYEVMQIYAEQVQRLISKDDRPLDSKDAAKEEEKVQKIIDKRNRESEDARQKRENSAEKEREKSRQFVREVADAYNFRLSGTKSLDGRDTWVMDAEPRPGFQPHSKEAKLLPKFRGRLWIDKAELQWAKLDIECIDTVSLGVFLARIHKGARIVVEQTPVNGEVWLPKHVAAKVDVRVALLKDFNVEQEQTFRDYKKFRTAARIVKAEEIPSSKK